MFLSNYFRGALTSKPYAFLARPWEFKSVDSIDLFDSLGSNIRIDLRGDKILRILPRSNDSINEDWISDKIRFVCDAARLQRLDSSILKLNNSFFNLSWTQVFDFLRYLSTFNFLSSFSSSNFLSLPKLNYFRFLPGLFVDLDSASILNRVQLSFFYKNLNSSVLLKNFNFGLDRDFIFFNNKFDNLTSFQNLILVGLNIKTISPVLAIRLRGLVKSGVKVYNFGQNSSQSSFFDVGSLSDFNKFTLGKHWLNSKLLKEKSFFLFGESFNVRNNNLVYKFLNRFNFNFGIVSSNVSFLNLQECSSYNNVFETSSQNNLSMVDCIQTNCSTSFFSDLERFNKDSFLDSFKISLVSHGGGLAELSDLLVPISSPFEQSKIYLNLLGIKQKTRLCFSSPNNVLDHSDFLSFFYSSLLKNYLLTFDKVYFKSSLLLHLLFFGNFCLVSFSNKIWGLVNYFFDLIEGNSFVLSHFVLYFFSNLNFLVSEFSENSDLLVQINKNLKYFVMPTRLKNFGLLNDRLLANNNFYQNDEISLVSSTLSGASSRLINKSSFIF